MEARSRMSVRTHEEMRPVLLDPNAEGPVEHYYMIRAGAKRGNTTVWQTGTVGREYIKTFGHYHTWDFKEEYKILSGEGVALLQKRVSVDGVAQTNAIEDFKVVRVRAGDTLAIPFGYGHILCNTGESLLVTIDNSPSDDPSRPHADYEPIKEMHGFAYYLVDTEGSMALVRNPQYVAVVAEDLAGIPILQ